MPTSRANRHPHSRSRPRSRRLVANGPARGVTLVAAIALLAAGCSSGKSSSRGSGPVDVLYAGSLLGVMEQQIGPRFRAATGYDFQGFSGGSQALASQIKGRVRQGDVFISASTAVDKGLEGPSGGGWVNWYARFATSPLVLGYNPSSRFAAALKTEPWYQVLSQPGILVGRTDPVADPKGKLAVQALEKAATSENVPALNAMAHSSAGVYPEETLVGRLQAGQLDVGFFYASEAAESHIPTVSLSPVSLEAVYTVSVLEHAPHQKGGESFVAFLLGPQGQAILRQDGFSLSVPAESFGTGVPSALSKLVSSGGAG